MKKLIQKSIVAALAFVLVTASAFSAEILVGNGIYNGNFESGSQADQGWPYRTVPIWSAIVDIPVVNAPFVGAQNGIYAVELSNNFPPGFGFAFIEQRLRRPTGEDQNVTLAVTPGDEIYASAYVLTETPLVSDIPTARIMKIGFFDEFGNDLETDLWSKGRLDAGQFPGIEGYPVIDSASDPNVWHKTQLQGMAPDGAVEVGIFLFNINLTNIRNPIWYDNVTLARLDPDDDGDGLANSIDADPLLTSSDFTDRLKTQFSPDGIPLPPSGTTSGTVLDDDNEILSIDDEADPEGMRISAGPGSGSGSPARVRVCDASATLTIRPNSELVMTCGSVILTVEPGSEPVTMAIEFGGENATVEVTPDNTVTFEPESDTLAVTSTAAEPAPVILTVGGSDVELSPGETVRLLSIDIDIKPGSDPNCFNINSNGVVPVAILGSGLLDVTSVNQSSLDFGGLGVRIRGNDQPSCGMEDTNADGHTDLICHFEDDANSWIAGSAPATLSGALMNGTVVSGTDSICVVP